MGMFVMYSVVMSTLSITRHQAFASSYDLANMAETVWQTSQGHIFSLTGATSLVSRFRHHSDVWLILLAPFYKVWPDVRLLLIIQSMAIGSSAIPIFLIGRKLIKNDWVSLVVAAVYLANPGVLWTNIYDFHTIALAIPLLFWAYYLMLAKKWRWMYVAMGLSLLTKEDVGLFVSMMGINLFLVERKEWRRALAIFLIGGCFSVAMVKIVMPFFSDGAQHWAWSWFGFEGSIWEKLRSSFADSSALSYYQALLEPYAFLPLLGGWWLLAAAPDLVLNCISNQAQMKSIVFHYDALISVAILVSLIVVLAQLRHRKLLLYPAILMILFFSARQNYFYSPLPTTPGHWPLMYQVGKDEIAFEKVLQTIPPEATVTASSEVRTHTINHRLAFNLPNAAETADYVAMVDQNRIVGDYNPKEFETALIEKLKNNPDYTETFHQGHFYLFKRVD